MLESKKLYALSAELITEPNRYMHSFRENVRRYLDKKEITLFEVAELADIPESTLKSFVYGKSGDCYLSLAVKLARVFKVSVDELVGCGTLSPLTTESIRITRQFPECYLHFIRWTIRFHKEMLDQKRVSLRAIEVMTPEVGEGGNLKISYELDLLDIANISNDMRAKISIGIRIPNNQYAPYYSKNDILLLANDRNAFPTETTVMVSDDNLWLMKKKKGNDGAYKYYSILDNGLIPPPKNELLVFGYVVRHVKSMAQVVEEDI